MRALLNRPFDGRKFNPFFEWVSWLTWAGLVVCQWAWSGLSWQAYSDRMAIPLGVLAAFTLLYTLTLSWERRVIPLAVFSAWLCLALGERLTTMEDTDSLRKSALLVGTLAVAACLLHDRRIAGK